mgnify:CR=1 FL=1
MGYAINSALNGLKSLGSAVINVGKQAIESYADYEQLTGGVETLFKDSADEVIKNADQYGLNRVYLNSREFINCMEEIIAKKEENVIFGGRLAEYKYYDMDAVIASALEKCKELF